MLCVRGCPIRMPVIVSKNKGCYYYMTDIVGQITSEMNLTGDMLDAMQQQQMRSGIPGSMPGSVPDFSQLSPQQQMAMMERYNQQASQPMVPPPVYDAKSDGTSDTSSSDLGLDGKPMGWMDSLINKLKNPIIVVVIFIIFSLTQFDGLIRPLLPAILNSGFYFLCVKGLCAGLTFLLTQLLLI
jgi:hypothetical protein